MQDEEEDRATRKVRDNAAGSIQAILKGVLCRTFLKKDTAIRKIQKVVKLWLFRYSNLLKNNNLKGNRFSLE